MAGFEVTIEACACLKLLWLHEKYEIYLPVKYNDGTEIEPEKFKQIREELIAVFGAVTVNAQSAPYQKTP